MKYVIELTWKDEENYECKEYFKSVYVDGGYNVTEEQLFKF